MRRIAIFISAVMLFAGGCATTKTITVNTKPNDASIYVDGQFKGRGQITEQFVFDDRRRLPHVTASRMGFKEQTVPISRDYQKDTLLIELKPQTKHIIVNILPVPAVLSVDGKSVTGTERVGTWAGELEFSVDSKNYWTRHTITAERNGYQPSEQGVTFIGESIYTLTMEPMHKDITINTTPPGANVYFDGAIVGTSPYQVKDRAFPIDPATDQYIPLKVKVTKLGYENKEAEVSWDEGKTDYSFDLGVKTKTVRLKTEPAGAAIALEGREMKPDASGAVVLKLNFPPINDRGELKTYSVVATKKPEGEYQPAEFNLTWDEGKSDYTIAMKEIPTRKVSLLTALWTRDDAGWEVEPKWIETLGRKDIAEDTRTGTPLKVTSLPPGTTIDTLSVSPDGSQILFTILTGTNRNDFRSQICAVKTSGGGGVDYLSDGKSLDLTPSYSPDGSQIVYSSNRAGRRMSVWQISASGARGISQLTLGENNDLWPTLDSDPQPKLYYQSLIDTRESPQLFSSGQDRTLLHDLQVAGAQPRVSPRNDSIIFTAMNEKTGKRDIYKVSLGGVPQNLTNTPDVDEFDPTWNITGSKIAFASDRGMDSERRRNFDIWIMDINKPEQPAQLTTNGSQDDCPAWDPAGKFIYFRSNRGGEWAIWKVQVGK